MKSRRRVSNKTITKYCILVEEAIALGVPLADIMGETCRYHGNEFADRVLDALMLKAS